MSHTKSALCEGSLFIVYPPPLMFPLLCILAMALDDVLAGPEQRLFATFLFASLEGFQNHQTRLILISPGALWLVPCPPK